MLGVLVIGLRVYTVPVSMIPFINAPSELTPIIEGKPVIGLSTMAAIAAIYYFLIYAGQYLSERSLFEENHIATAYDELHSSTLARQIPQTIDEQLASSYRSEQYKRNHAFTYLGGFIRGITDWVAPILLTGMVLYVEIENILSLLRVLL